MSCSEPHHVTGPVPLERIKVLSYRVPTDAPEADGTLAWDSTTLVVVEAAAGGQWGMGYSYTEAAAARLIDDKLVPVIEGTNVLDVPRCWEAMVIACRNLGRPGLVSSAIAAVDTALWDLKSRLLGVSLVALLGGCREAVPVYGSGGFTSYPTDRLQRQLGGWVESGISRVKMKVGSKPDEDVARVAAAREAIGAGAELFVDANGAYSRKQALDLGWRFWEVGRVSWFEEPVSSDDLSGLRLLRDRLPRGMEVAAGEYGYRLMDFLQLLQSGAVDVLQVDITRCAGITELLRVAGMARAFQIPLSAHTAPALHLPVMCALPGVRHLEYFHDHVRIEARFFEGVQTPVDGWLRPDRERPGHGLGLRHKEAAAYAV